MADLTCPWEVTPGDCCPEADQVDPSVLDAAVGTASAILTRLSGFTVGECPVTLRPLEICRECRTWCCGGTDGIRLMGPSGTRVSAVSSVHIGADTVPDDQWRYDGDVLWRVPPDRWPLQDARWADCGSEGAFCVDATVGSPPDSWALYTAEMLVCELIKSCAGGKCRLPRNATTITGQGITVQLRDEEINHFIPEVSAWVAAVNPHSARLPARVYSPDLRPARGPHAGLRLSLRGCCG